MCAGLMDNEDLKSVPLGVSGKVTDSFINHLKILILIILMHIN